MSGMHVPPTLGPILGPALPARIPDELCVTLDIDPRDPAAPDACVAAMRDDVGRDGFSARGLEPAQRDQLQQIVTDARGDGVDLKVVVLDQNPPMDSWLRDVAVEVGNVHPDATVLVLSPSFAGTYSTQFDRVTLEAGEDLAKTGNPVQSTQNFVSQLNTPIFPWTTLTIALLMLVAGIAVLVRVGQVRGRKPAVAAAGPGPSSAEKAQADSTSVGEG